MTITDRHGVFACASAREMRARKHMRKPGVKSFRGARERAVQGLIALRADERAPGPGTGKCGKLGPKGSWVKLLGAAARIGRCFNGSTDVALQPASETFVAASATGGGGGVAFFCRFCDKNTITFALRSMLQGGIFSCAAEREGINLLSSNRHVRKPDERYRYSFHHAWRHRECSATCGCR